MASHMEQGDGNELYRGLVENLSIPSPLAKQLHEKVRVLTESSSAYAASHGIPLRHTPGAARLYPVPMKLSPEEARIRMPQMKIVQHVSPVYRTWIYSVIINTWPAAYERIEEAYHLMLQEHGEHMYVMPQTEAIPNGSRYEMQHVSDAPHKGPLRMPLPAVTVNEVTLEAVTLNMSSMTDDRLRDCLAYLEASAIAI